MADALVDHLLEMLEAGAREGRHRPVSVLVAECQDRGVDATLVLAQVWRKLRLQVMVQRAHAAMLAAYCRNHSGAPVA